MNENRNRSLLHILNTLQSKWKEKRKWKAEHLERENNDFGISIQWNCSHLSELAPGHEGKVDIEERNRTEEGKS